MSYHGYDPGDRNNWYQSPYLGLSPAGYGGGISGGYYRAPYHPYGSSTCAFTQFSSQPSPYPPLQLNPSATIINVHLFPHQFPGVAQQPLTTTPHDPYIPTYHSPHSNSNPGIYPSISQSHSYDPSDTGVHSQFIFTKAMTTPPIYLSAPSPPACEQPQYHMNTSIPTPSHPHPSEVYHHWVGHFTPTNQFGPPPSTHEQPRPILDLKQVETDLQLCPIPMEPDRVRDSNWEVPIIDTVKLKGAEKPLSPPRGSGEFSHKDFELQGHKDHTDAKLCEMRETFKSSMDTFMSEFREELRWLWGSKQTPAGQVDNPRKFGSLPSSTHKIIPATIEASSSLVLSSNGNPIITSLNTELNLSHHEVIFGFTSEVGTEPVASAISTLSTTDPHEVILDLHNDISVVVVSESSNEDNIAVGMADKLNIVSNSMGASTGNREYEIQSAEGAVVTVKSIGKLRDGKKFLKKGHGEGEAPFDFKKNEEQVIEELEKTVVTMRKVLDEASLPSNFMDDGCYNGWVFCSIEAITCIPQCLYALCLNNNGFQAVKDALRCLVEVFTSRKYLRALTNDKLGELMFHASSLHSPDVDMLIEILNAISNIGHRVDASLTSTALLSSSTPVPIEADGEERNVVMTDYRESSKMDSLEQGTEPSSDSLVGYAELLLPGCVSKVARLLETVLQNGDICLIILEKKRIEVVLQLFTLPLMPLSVTVSPSIPIAFKNFTPQHSASLAWVVCYTDYQPRSHLWQWFTLCFELCNCETTKEPPLSCRLIQTLVSRVFTTIISGPQYFQSDFYEVLCDLYKLYVVTHNPFNDNAVNMLPDDTFGIMGSVASFVVDMYAHFGASLISEMEKQCEKECSKVYMLDSTQGHLILALETVHFRAACPWALWSHCLALPADKNGFLTVFSSQFCDFILLKANPCQLTTWGQIVSLRFDTAVIYLLIPNVKLIFIIGGITHNNLNHAALPIAFWSPQMCKDIDQLQTHSTIIITLVVGVISENINDQTKAIPQPRSFSIDEVIDFLQINLEFSSSRYSSDPLLSIGYGVVLMPNMHKFSQYMVGHVHKDDYFLATSSSNFYSSVHAIHALVRKLFPLSPMAAIRPLLVNIIREDAHCISGIMLVISMIELVSLKSRKQGFEIMYGDVSDGNYCSHMSCSLYFLDFMITWFIEFGFVASVVIGFTVSVTWHLIKGVKEDLKNEIIAALFKEVEGLCLTPIATESSYFYGKTTVLMTIFEDKLAYKWLFELQFSRMLFLICRLIDWKRCQAYPISNLRSSFAKGGWIVMKLSVRSQV